MADIARLFDFAPATTIVSADVDAELNQLVAAVNDRANNPALVAGLAKGSFSARRGASEQTVATGATVVFDSEEWDTDGWYNATTGIFTPLMAGIWLFSWMVQMSSVVPGDGKIVVADLYKNSVIQALRGQISQQRATGSTPNSVGGGMLKANGSSDNFRVKLTHDNGGSLGVQPDSTFFQAHYVGPA